MRDDLPHISGDTRLSRVTATFESAGQWRPDELGAMFSHQLDTDLAVDLLDGLPGPEKERLSAVAAAIPDLRTFRDLLLHARPPAELLVLARAFARRPSTARHAGPPSAILRALDVAIGATARLHAVPGVDLPSTAELSWLAGLTWAEQAARDLARRAVALTDAPAAPERPAIAAAAGFNFMPVIDGYEITGRLGEGGMGVVWRALQLSTGRPVAIKLMSAAAFGSERARLRFEREVRLTARLDHPQIAGVYESGLHRGAYYYAMELVEGVPLDRFVQQTKLTVAQILELLRSVCAAVAHAHARGIVHRDLKPGNILVDAAGVPHVLDFGLAKALQEAQPSMTAVTLTGEMAGTPAFMAPEQVAGAAADCDTRTDVYALGVVLFHLLTGAFPHELTGTRLEVFRRIGEVPPRRLRDVMADADPRLDALIARVLTLRPEERLADAGAFAAEIDRYLAGGRAPASPRRQRLRRRLVAAVAILLVAGILLTIWLWPLPTLDGGPSIGGRLYVNAGQPYRLRLRPGLASGPPQAWRIDWGNGQTQSVGGDITSIRHVYPVEGRYQIRVAAQVGGRWYRANTGSHPIHRWTGPDGDVRSYALTDRRGTWDQVHDEAWARQGLLVSINGKPEQDFLIATFLKPSKPDWYWIGLTNQSIYGNSAGRQFVWDDGTGYDKAKVDWARGQPQEATGTQSGAFNYAHARGEPDGRVGQLSALNDTLSGAAGTTAVTAQGIIEFADDPPYELLVVVTNVFQVPAEEEDQ